MRKNYLWSKIMFWLSTLVMLSSQAFAVNYTIDYEFAEFTRSNVLDLQSDLLVQHDLDLSKFKLDQITLVAKSKGGQAKATLRVEEKAAPTIVIPGRPQDYDNNRPNTFKSLVIHNPKAVNKATAFWGLELEGNIKIAKIVVQLTKLGANPPPPPPPPPARPVTAAPGLKSIIAADQAINLVWHPVANATYYTVLHSTSSANRTFDVKDTKLVIPTNGNIDQWVSVLACNSLGCGPKLSLPTIKIAPKASLIQYNPANVSATQLGVSWQPIIGVTYYSYLVSTTGFNFPAAQTTQNWFVLDTNTSVNHWVTVFPCNEAGCGNGAPLGPLRR